MEATKVCGVCRIRKPLEGFHIRRDPKRTGKRRGGAASRQSTCRTCSPGVGRAWRHNLSVEQYEALARAQGFACAVCRRVTTLHVDHDHACCPGDRSCGRCVRGLLSGKCNRGIGMFQNDYELLQEAAAYVRNTEVPA